MELVAKQQCVCNNKLSNFCPGWHCWLFVSQCDSQAASMPQLVALCNTKPTLERPSSLSQGTGSAPSQQSPAVHCTPACGTTHRVSGLSGRRSLHTSVCLLYVVVGYGSQQFQPQTLSVSSRSGVSATSIIRGCWCTCVFLQKHSAGMKANTLSRHRLSG